MGKQQKTLLVLAIISAFVGAAIFLPGPVGAGDLEPSAPPGPTMKTLDQIPPTWSQKLDASERFELVLDGEAVLDKETGLVWERSPSEPGVGWPSGCPHCYQKKVANRKGWRLPTIEELASLVDDDNTNWALPTGHPFNLVPGSFGIYWSSTAYGDAPESAWCVDFEFGTINKLPKESNFDVWCVRGGYGHDAY